MSSANDCPIFSRASTLIRNRLSNDKQSQPFLGPFDCKQLPHQLTTTAMIRFLKRFSFSSLRQTTSNHHYHKQVPFAISWTVLLLLVPLQATSQAMIIPVSSSTNSTSNQKPETNELLVIKRYVKHF